MNVLVTGARGFIGSNLRKKLALLDNIKVFEYNREHTPAYLKEIIGDIDFIYHFAGEVDPKSSDEAFEQSNAHLTKDIIAVIEASKRTIPFLMTSSIHAELQKNTYGTSKREAEIYLENYGKRNNVPVWIYRLPHIFGEGCKPNYNSVISTWIHNSIHDKEIIVFDRAIPMTYAYVQDIVDEFISCLGYDQNAYDKNSYTKPKTTYNTTLGEVADYIEEFKNSNNKNIHYDSGFKAKLYVTYLDYMKKKTH